GCHTEPGDGWERQIEGAQGAEQQRAEDNIDLAERQFAPVKLGHAAQREPKQPSGGQPPFRQEANRPIDEREPCYAREGIPNSLRIILTEPCERCHSAGEYRQVFELVMAVLRTIEWLSVEHARRGLSIDNEVAHVAADAYLEEQQSEHGAQEGRNEVSHHGV